ncbi:DUF1311 domain-containing protein [Clostridium botulinum]|uniref:lysozyme inhibitor LprI family protein n=1 Tax=Clostridium botulinum TaxID=1491 RepID=UPI00069130B0|nr:lysozyme inhibitor LprI family protein [Clostridium botulinum]NFO97495.1 DUF1311 domain-containing protein [Clostridium botulinum]OOV51424.1 hypothetical protein B1A66_09370 [Clostridium botulinum D/C]OOV58593.1 hypothetical protein B0673_01920 [Clostridium botulinum D/C]OOV59792.1 hypothetical protein B1A67_00380 [Clostridium botulinum D/C]OOV60213.1 hypothetical protein B1A68_02980 [Clostridium botulinum D/C]
MKKRLKYLFIIIITFTSVPLLSGCSTSKSNNLTSEAINSPQISNTKNDENLSKVKLDSSNSKSSNNTIDSKISSNNIPHNKNFINSSNKQTSKNSKKAKIFKTKKQSYLNKLNSTETTLNTRLEKKFAGTTLEMRQAAEERYIIWDKHLNQIYSDLKNTLPINAINNLKKEQIKWISNRDKEAQKKSDLFKGGSIMPIQNLMSIGNSTKKRCYELVNKYMD